MAPTSSTTPQHQRRRPLTCSKQSTNLLHTRHTHLHEALPCLLLTDEALGDVLLEAGEQVAEQGDVVPEQTGAGYAPGVQGGEGHACLLVQAPVVNYMEDHTSSMHVHSIIVLYIILIV